MLLGVVSDTHGQVQYTREAVRMLESLGPHLVIHCGDVGSTQIVPLFAAWPTHFVLGNVDEDAAEMEEAIRAAGQSFHGPFGSLEVAARRIAFLHGHDGPRLKSEIADGGWDLLCYGHTHKSEVRRAGATLVLNPGALYRAHPHSLAIVDLDDLVATIVSL